MCPPIPEPVEGQSVFVPSAHAAEERRRRWPIIVAVVLALAAAGSVGFMVVRPALTSPLRSHQLDSVERVATAYLKAITAEDTQTLQRLGTVEEPPAIRSVRSVTRNPGGNRQVKGSFAPLGKLHTQIASGYDYDSTAGRFTPKNAMGPAAKTLDSLHEAKDNAEKSGLYKKMQSGDPNDLFDAAEQFGKVFTQLAETTLAPKAIVPTYKMLVEESKPPLPADVKALALEVSESPNDWSRVLKRSFHTLKADGPFIYEQAEVIATATDRLASSGDPPSRLRLKLIRFRLEGIDTGWKVINIHRVLPGEDEKPPARSAPSSSSSPSKSPVLTPSANSQPPNDASAPIEQ